MTKLSERVLDEALSLPVDARVVLVDRLLASLNVPTPSDIEEEWKHEVDRRATELDSGRVEMIPGEEVLDRIRAKFAK